MTMDMTAALNSAPGHNQNARLGHIRRCVCNPPERAQVLKLVTVEEQPITLGEWTRVSCVDNSATALLIDEILQEHADVLGEQITATLVWTESNGTPVTHKRLRTKPTSAQGVELVGDPNAPSSAEAMGIDGTDRGARLQKQREHEYAMRSYFAAHQTQIAQGTALLREHREWANDAINQTRELAITLGGLLKDSWMANHESQLQLDKLRGAQRLEMDRMHLALRETAESAEEQSGEPLDPKQQLYATVGKALEVALPFVVQAAAAQFAQRAQGMPADAATPPSSAHANPSASPRAA